mgnify:CR=1 FL=1
MSTLTVATIKSLSGSPTVFQKNNGTEIGQLAMAWVNINGDSSTDGEFAIRDSFNISSVEDTATGVYTVNINTDMADTNYVVVVTVEAGTDNDQTSEGGLLFQNSTKTAGSFKIRTGDTETNNNDDYGGVNAVVFGD